MKEKVDILIATYNGEKFIKEQIDSILNQTYQNIQLIISDDCSTDKTREILKQYEQNDKIKIFYQEKNLGYLKNFEFLLKKVESNFYMLSDQDDVWKKEKVEKSVEKLEKENLDLVFGDLEVVDENLNTIYDSFSKYKKLDKKIEKCIGSYQLQYLYNCITGCTILSKKEYLNKILPFPTTSKYMVHDYWIGFIVSLYGKVGYLKEPYIKYRQHGENQIGVKRAVSKIKNFEDLRNFLIEIKLGIFETYVENEERIPEKLRKQNRQALEYYKMIKNKKKINFASWGTFYKLYKQETISFFIKNFIILNMPFIVVDVFKRRSF